MCDPQIDMTGLEGGPHATLIREMAKRSMSDPAVQAVWVGGSLANGTGDDYSDVDYRIAVEPEAVSSWEHPVWQTYMPLDVVGSTFMRFGENALLHHLIVSDGTIVDYYVQSTQHKNREPSIAILGHRNPDFYQALCGFRSPASELAKEVDQYSIRQFLVDYWITTHKEMKGLARHFDSFQFVGLYLERMMLLRAWHIEATGTDIAGRLTIHVINAMHRALEDRISDEQIAILGMPCRTPVETAEAIGAIRREMSASGRRLADRYGFDYPTALQDTVESAWERRVQSLIG